MFFLQKTAVIITFLLLKTMFPDPGQILKCENGKIQFTSDASLETIRASSKELKGILNLTREEFAFKVKITSFEGFNSPLQRVHFFENFIEAVKYPEASYSGRIIDLPIEWKNLASVVCRTKGMLRIHGIEVERIIDVKLQKKGNTINFSSVFTVPLNDHEIRIPRIVDQKISKEIDVKVEGNLIF